MANQDIVKNSIAEAMKSLVREKCIEDISVMDICQRCSVNRRTFYRYFSDKFEVIEWIHYSDFLQRLQMPSESSLYYYMSAAVDLIMEDREYYINALKYKGQNSFRQYSSHHLSKLVYSDLRRCFQSDDMYYLYVSHSNEMIFDFFELYLTTKPNVTRDDLLQVFRELLYNPSKRYVELLEREYPYLKEGPLYHTAEPSRAQKKAK